MQVCGVGAWRQRQGGKSRERGDGGGAPEEAFAVAEEVGGGVRRVGKVGAEDLVGSRKVRRELCFPSGRKWRAMGTAEVTGGSTRRRKVRNLRCQRRL